MERNLASTNSVMATKDDKKRKRTIRSESSTDMGIAGIEIKKIKSGETIRKDSRTSLFYTEEEEVDTRDPKNDLELFRTACNEVENAARKIHDLKKKKMHATSEIESSRVQASLQFVILKKLNRLAHIRCKKVREKTNEAKQDIEHQHLQLQNMLYETMHLEKEITKCLEFKSKDEEIELVPESDFYRDAPEAISRPEKTKSDEHQRTLARLDWELEQRMQLFLKLKDAQGKRENIEKDIKTKEEYLNNLHPKLDSILSATKPVQDYLEMPFERIREQHQVAGHLPHPLYVLFMQASAYKQACDKYLNVTIEGDIDTAKSFDMSTPDLDEDSDSEQEEQEKASSKRRRKTTDIRKLERKDKVLRKHPLSVLLEVKTKDGNKLCLTFYYLVALHIITVSIKLETGQDAVTSSVSGEDLLSPDSILCDLYAGDHGNTTPNPANHYELNRLGLREFGQYIVQVGLPYLWAQWLGGLDFLADRNLQRPQSAVSAGHMQKTIKELRKRVSSRLSLLRQLSSLERNAVSVISQYQSLFPTKIVSQLTSWKRSTYNDFCSLSHTKTVMDADLVSENDMYFVMVASRGTARLTSQVVIAHDYPAVAPLFVVSVKWRTERTAVNDYHIRKMEEEVNVHYNELIIPQSRDQILSNQIQRLLMCFDIYLETEVENINNGVSEIAKEKVFPRCSRGPNRNKPFRYCSEVGIFTHR
ncbi:hypothetical protein ScPMuIL_005735 [Solemya velum]